MKSSINTEDGEAVAEDGGETIVQEKDEIIDNVIQEMEDFGDLE